ncbi:cytochrome c oxidase subunit IV [Actinomadura hallensis]|uniref:Cytochrome c oxidase polypeptide 4 n=1 Tax=Actinomadura hallensis TaxID=337895 RepID=A0A543IHW1_9ACTN|nr:cytochrome c oxidase subunit 4 [Actinomadura hallensis]TQM70161.1 cytochrome c oxidase subunit IV [Actinomadura hallensis]HLV72572.1 cytochrome c oxidase subunit 4 [Vulgatibacteraceae bacterium]
MRVQAFMFYGTALFFLVTDVVYWLWSKDWTGTTALGLAVGLAGLIGFYTHFTIRRLERANNGPLYEDDPEGEISDAAGEVGFFSPHSWWPLYCGLSAAIVTLGIVFGWWLFMFGLAAAFLSTMGLVFEYYRGHFAH